MMTKYVKAQRATFYPYRWEACLVVGCQTFRIGSELNQKEAIWHTEQLDHAIKNILQDVIDRVKAVPCVNDNETEVRREDVIAAIQIE